MNKRQTEKHFKRKWQRLFCKIFNDNMGLNVKPSRMKLHAYEVNGKTYFDGRFSGYSFKIGGD